MIGICPNTEQDNPALEAEVGAKVISVDYTDSSSAQKTLEDHQIHTVISALSIQSEEHSNAQIGLIHAAAAASSVKRFVPSEFGIPYEEKLVLIALEQESSLIFWEAYSSLAACGIQIRCC